MNPLLSKKESILWLNVNDVHWDVVVDTSLQNSPTIQLVTQAWLSSGKPQLVMRFDNNNPLWEPLANFLMSSFLSMGWIVETFYSPTPVVAITRIV